MKRTCLQKSIMRMNKTHVSSIRGLTFNKVMLIFQMELACKRFNGMKRFLRYWSFGCIGFKQVGPAIAPIQIWNVRWLLVNPAYVGNPNYYSVTIGYDNKFSGILKSVSPQTLFFSAHSRWERISFWKDGKINNSSQSLVMQLLDFKVCIIIMVLSMNTILD